MMPSDFTAQSEEEDKVLQYSRGTAPDGGHRFPTAIQVGFGYGQYLCVNPLSAVANYLSFGGQNQEQTIAVIGSFQCKSLKESGAPVRTRTGNQLIKRERLTWAGTLPQRRLRLGVGNNCPWIRKIDRQLRRHTRLRAGESA